MVILGLLLLVVSGAVVVNAGVVNRGPAHGMGDFTVFGYVLEGSSGTIFLYGVIAGAAAITGIYFTLVGAWRSVGHRLHTHRELRRIRREKEALAAQRDQLADKLDEERAVHSADTTTETARPTAGTRG